MKVTLNLTKLLSDKKITQAEYDKFVSIAKADTRGHAYSILIVFGALSVALGFVGLFQAEFVQLMKFIWDTLEKILGSFLGKHLFYFLLTSAILSAGFKVRSGFLVCTSCFVILTWLNTSFDNQMLVPAIIIISSLLSYGALNVSKGLEFEYANLALLFARICLIFVNIAFWAGSRAGSKLGSIEISDSFFAATWAFALLWVGVWGAREGRRFVVNTAGVFGAIHFYTQWFRHLGANPTSMIVAGLVALFILYGFRWFNQNGLSIAKEKNYKICAGCKAINFKDAFRCKRCTEPIV